MTDKQMEEKKGEFLKRFVDVFEYEEDWNEGASFRITTSINEVWDFIEKLVEEVEDECEKKSFENFKKRLMLDLEKKLTI